MHEEKLISVGIDVGTSTTQCVFSELTLQNLASAFSVPRISITNKRILYRAPTRLTPLLDENTIDASRLRDLIASSYREAGITPQMIRLGAVIITGETARKQNARAVTQALSELAGDFVVATAGPALESILAGKGSGSAHLSETTGRKVLNLDIGGGTTNMALFDKGAPIADGCLDLGGRLLRFEEDDRTVHSFSQAISRVALDVGISLRTGMILDDEQIRRITRRMAELLEEAANLRSRTALHDSLAVEHSLPVGPPASLFTFSGGVADCVYERALNETHFHDLGDALGAAIRASAFFSGGHTVTPEETGHATVIGAGAYSVTVSGSTIDYRGVHLPLRALPVGKVPLETEADISSLGTEIRKQYEIFDGECAIGLTGLTAPSFVQIEAIAEAIAPAVAQAEPKVLILEKDMAKALGQALRRRWPRETPFLCLDGISLAYGDTVDIGAPLSDGRVVPVIVKTLAFAAKSEAAQNH